MSAQFNPYTAPASPSLGEGRSVDQFEAPMPASLGARFLNLLIDTIPALILGGVFGFLAAAGEVPIGGPESQIIQYGGMFLYYTLSEGLTGRTLGKLVTGTKVIGRDGRPPGLGAAAVRSLCRFIPFEPLSVLFRDGFGWHDTIPRTQVVRAR